MTRTKRPWSIKKRLLVFFSLTLFFTVQLFQFPVLAYPNGSTDENRRINNDSDFIQLMLKLGLNSCYSNYNIVDNIQDDSLPKNKNAQASSIRAGNFFNRKGADDTWVPDIGGAGAVNVGGKYKPIAPPNYHILKYFGVSVNKATDKGSSDYEYVRSGSSCDSTYINTVLNTIKSDKVKTPLHLFCASGGVARQKTGTGKSQTVDCTNSNAYWYMFPSSNSSQAYSKLQYPNEDAYPEFSYYTDLSLRGQAPSPVTDRYRVLYLTQTILGACDFKKQERNDWNKNITTTNIPQGYWVVDGDLYSGPTVDRAFYIYAPSTYSYLTLDLNNPDAKEMWKVEKSTCSDALKKLPTLNKELKEIAEEEASGGSNGNKEIPPSIDEIINNSSSDGSGGDATSSCNVEGGGWIICPVVTFLAKVTDGAMGFLEKNFLRIEADLLGTKTQNAWEAVRNIANTAFVILFLVVTFSQLTGFGISNYGIKTMLPRLVVGAIVVNLSFVICQLAVDVSNLVGNGIGTLMSGIAQTIGGDELLSYAASNNIDTSSTWTWLAGGALVAGGAVLFVGLGALIPILLGAIVAALGILLILAARKALIVMLVIISPLAIIAFLFPNKGVNSLFGKWQKIFVSLLMLYPIVSFVYFGSKLASNILTDTYTEAAIREGEAPDAFNIGQIIAAGVGVLPLFLIPGMLKKSLDGLGKVGATISGMSGKLQGGAKNKWTNSDLAKNMEKNKAENRATIHGGTYHGKNPFNKARSGVNRLVNKIPSSYGHRRSATGETMADKQNKEDVEMASVQLANKNLDPVKMLNIAKGEGEGKNNIAMRQAAIKSVVESDDVAGLQALWDQSLEMKSNEKDPNAKLVRSALADSLMASSSRSAGLGAGAIASLKSGTLDTSKDTFHGTLRQAIEKGSFSPDKLVSEDGAMLAEVRKAIQFEDRGGAPLTREQTTRQESMKRQMEVAAHQAQTNPNTSVKIGKTKTDIDNFARRIYPPPAP